MTDKTDEEKKIASYEPDVKNVIRKYKAKNDVATKLPTIKASLEKGNANLACKDELSSLALANIFGTMSAEFASHNLITLAKTICSKDDKTGVAQHELNSIIAALNGIDAKNEIEGMLASQMVATHFAALNQLNFLRNAKTLNHINSHGNIAVKLMRTYTTQLEALQKYRGKGQQKMTVEHVHVNAGGQAIIGNVNNQGGANNIKTEEQPHATVVSND